MFTAEDVDTWYRSGDRKIFLSDALDPSNSESMSVGFARYAAGEWNEWVVTYDEALIVTRGAYTVTSADGVETTARAGEVIFLRKGTPVVYSAKEEGADVVYVTYPHWMDAQRQSEHAGFPRNIPPSRRASSTAERRRDGCRRAGAAHLSAARARRVARFQALLRCPRRRRRAQAGVGELRGKQAVVDYFEGEGETVEFRPFEEPLEYDGDGDRVVIVGDETFKVKQTGVTHRAEWAWVVDVRDGLITRIVEIQDLSGVAEPIRAIVSKAQPASEHAEPGDAVALVRSIYDPLERGEARDSGGLFDALAEDAVLTTPVGEVRGKQAVIGYFANAAETLEYDIFVRPLEYYGNSKRVVQLGGETFRVKATGATHEADWAWVFDVEDGHITQILAIMDLSGVAAEVAEALDKAQKKRVSSGP